MKDAKKSKFCRLWLTVVVVVVDKVGVLLLEVVVNSSNTQQQQPNWESALQLLVPKNALVDKQAEFVALKDNVLGIDSADDLKHIVPENF